MQAEELDENFPVVNIDSNALDAVRLLAEHRLNGLVVVTDTSETPYAVLPASQVVRFIVPPYVQEDPGLAAVLTELQRRNFVREGFVYFQITRGVAPRDFPFPKHARPTLVMTARSKRLVDQKLLSTGIGNALGSSNRQ